MIDVSGWRKRQIALDQKAENAHELGLDYEPEHEPTAVKRMMEWVYVLKRRSDNGQHMNIQSGLTAGTCWEFAIELEEFIKHSPPQRTWVGLTDEDLQGICDKWQIYNGSWMDGFVRDIESKLKERNT
jgi:hypothetical protein